MPVLTGRTSKREKSIPFRARGNATLVKDRYKLVLPKGELYDLSEDWGEENDIASTNPKRVEAMTRELMNYLDSMRKSHAGSDYNDPSYKPPDEWAAFKRRSRDPLP